MTMHTLLAIKDVLNSDNFAILITLEALDVILGLSRAVAFKQLNSGIGWVGNMRKAATLSMAILLGAVLMAEHQEALYIGLMSTFTIPVVLSIVENANALGIPVPNFIAQFFEDDGKMPVTNVVTPQVNTVSAAISNSNSNSSSTTQEKDH